MMKWKVIFVLCVVYVTYICIGGAVFQAPEKENEQNTFTSQAVAYEEFLNKSCVSKDELETFVKSLIEAYHQGVFQSESDRELNWDFPNAVFFSTTVVTTIGYGNLSPSTFSGRMFFIVYALIGIPITGMLLAGLGEKMHNGMKLIKARTFTLKCPKVEAIVKSSCLFLLFLLLLVFLPSILFIIAEGWSFGDSLYYCIVTMTTVGFGDFVPASTSRAKHRVPYRLFVAVWIIFGLAWLAMIINTIAAFYNERISKTDCRISSKSKTKTIPDITPVNDSSVDSIKNKAEEITNL